MPLDSGAVIDGRYLVERVLPGAHACRMEYVGVHQQSQAAVFIQEYLPRAIACRARNGHWVRPLSEAVRAPYEEGRARFTRETRALYRLHHPHCVATHAPVRAHGTSYRICTLHTGGAPLDALIAQTGALDLSVARAVLLPVLRALHAAHDHDLIHGNVTPAAVYLQPDGHPVLGRFQGAAWRTMRTIGEPEAVLQAAYSPPELYAEHGIVGPWSDIYGWAATFVGLVQGESPEPSPDADQVPAAWVDDVDALPPDLRHVLRYALARDTGRRPQSAGELADWVEEHESNGGTGGQRSEDADAFHPTSRREKPQQQAVEPALGRLPENEGGPHGQTSARLWDTLLPWLIAFLIVLAAGGIGAGVWKGLSLISAL